MITNRRVFTLAALCLVTVAAPALAGGGSKRDPKLHVTNDSGDQIGVILNATDSQLAAIASAGDPVAAFTAAGGKILNPGQKATFKVKAGEQKVTAIDATAVIVGEGKVKVEKGKDKSIKFNGSDFVE